MICHSDCRNKTGILGWRSEKTEVVNGYESKVQLVFLLTQNIYVYILLHNVALLLKDLKSVSLRNILKYIYLLPEEMNLTVNAQAWRTAFCILQVYCASNVELITRTRTDHLNEQHKAKPKGIHIENNDFYLLELLLALCIELALSFNYAP